MISLRHGLALLSCSIVVMPALADDTPISERAAKVHAAGFVFDGHNDLPWRLREEGDVTFKTIDISQRLDSGHTDIPRLREGNVRAQFWSVYIPSDQKDPARTVTEQIDLVHRMIERYPDAFELALTADDVERIAAQGKIASLIGIEGGVAIENDLAQLRAFARQGARYMTLTHNGTLPWADAAYGEPLHDGLTPFGERVVREMNRLGILVDISHVSAATMADALRVSQAPVIASHSNAYTKCPVPRNVPDDILALVKKNGGVIMANFYSGFVVPDGADKVRADLKAKYPDPKEYDAALTAYFTENPPPRGMISDVVDHIDYLVKTAGIDHVGLGADFDGVDRLPVGLDDVSSYPKITEELLKRGYSEADIHKIMSGNVIRAFREAGKVAERLQRTTEPEVDQPVKEAK